MLIYSFITDYQAFSLRYKDNTARDKNETKVGKQSANLGKNNEPIQNRLSFLIDCKSVILHHLTILSFPMVRPAWDNWWLLDYYPGYRDKETMKVIRHESLGIYIYANPKSKREQNFNDVMTEKAEAIRCRRFESVVNERYDFFDRYKLKGDFLEYYRKQLRKHDQKWEFVYLHFKNFVHGKCTFEEIDIDLCNKFRE